MDESDRLLMAGIKAALMRLPGPKYAKAGKLGVSATTIEKWIFGASKPNDTNLARLARLSGLDQETIRNGGVEYSED